MKKQLLAGLLTASMLLSVLPTTALAADAQKIPASTGQPAAESTADTYSISDGILTLGADWAAIDFAEGRAPWAAYTDEYDTIVIADGATTIGDYVLCGNLKSVTIPASVTSISAVAFHGCIVQKIEVNAGNPVYTSVDGLLYNKAKTTLLRCPTGYEGALSISDGVTEIGSNAFAGCSTLTDVTIPDSVKRIGSYAFTECGALNRVVIGDGVTDIGSFAFNDCTGLTGVTFGSHVKTISEYAFFSCYSLSNVLLPESVTSIGTRAFKNCTQLLRVYIPKSVTTIDIRTFHQCTSLQDVYYGGNEKQWSAIAIAEDNEPLLAAALHCNEAVKPGDSRFASPFFDVQDPAAYYYLPVLRAVSLNITSGKTSTLFAPEEACTRAQVITFLYREAGEPEVTVENPFEDVAETDYYYNAVLWGYQKGIVTGTTETTFEPDAVVSRAQFVTFLYRYAGKPAVTDTKTTFTDLPDGQYYTDAALWAFGNGITTGNTATTFAPDDDCTRGQVVTFLYRYAAKLSQTQGKNS